MKCPKMKEIHIRKAVSAIITEESVESVFELSFSHPPSEGPVRVVPKLLRIDGLYQNISHIISDRLSPSDVLLGNYEGTVLSHTFGLSGIDIAGNHSLSLILYGRSTSEYQRFGN